MKKDMYKSLKIFHFANLIRKNHKGTNLPQSNRGLRCVIFGNFGTMNMGDESLLAGELQELKKFEELKVTVVSRFPKEIKKLHHVQAISFYSFADILREVMRADFIIVGGGGLICKIDRGMLAFFYQLYMLTIFLLLPQLLRKNIYALGLGFYDNAHPIIAALAIQLLKNAQIVTVRDFHSYDLLKKRKVSVFLYKDNSYLMNISPVSLISSDSFFKKRYGKKRVHIGLSLVKPSSELEEKHIISQVTKFVEKQYRSADFWFYATDFYPNYVNDLSFGKQVHAHLKNLFGDELHFYFIPTNWGPEKFFGSFQLMDFFIGMRLHASIFCYRLNIPFVGISYDKKCSSFLESIGKDSVQISEVTSEYLEDTFRKREKS